MKETPIAPDAEYPMRINKYLAMKNITTRRGGDELVKAGKVYLNGKVAVLGDKVSHSDLVEVKYSGKPTPHVYYAYNKPVGVITHSPQLGEKDILEASGLTGVFPVGRLDKMSDGLIILTNDGRLTDKLLNPDREHDKEYIVTVANKLRGSFEEQMERGVTIEDDLTRPCEVDIIDDKTFSIVLTEGKKHQIRRMVEAMHNQVVTLRRTRIMNIELGDLGQNKYRKLGGEELQTLLASIGIL